MARCESARVCGRTATQTIPMFMGCIRVCEECESWYGADCTDKTPEFRVHDYVRIPELGVVGIVERITRIGWYVIRYLLEVDGKLTELIAYRGVNEIEHV